VNICAALQALALLDLLPAREQLPALLDPRAGSDAVDRFPEARRQYLQGHWREAEALLSECLQIESRDPPSMLLLAGVYRHTGRLAAAGRLLDQLERLEVAAAWWLECEAERARLTRYQNVEAEKSETASPDAESMPANQATADTSAAPEAPPATVGIGAAAADECLAAELTEASPAPPSA
jgi:thioredoxin-like negative regulator of GroEL